VDLCFLFMLAAVSPLLIELDRFVLPNGERGGDGIHEVDTILDPFDETLFKHFSECHIVVSTKPLILLEVLNVLFSGVGGHSNVLEFCSCGSAGSESQNQAWNWWTKSRNEEKGRSGMVFIASLCSLSGR